MLLQSRCCADYLYKSYMPPHSEHPDLHMVSHDHHVASTPHSASTDPERSKANSKMPAATHLTTNGSPFLLKAHDVETLAESDGFMILRDHLAQHYTYELCDAHAPAHLEDYPRWLMVRDVLHALLVPVVELFDNACSVASTATGATKLEDLEYAFTGSARSAFLWLQCFLSSAKERDWCYTRGCPACVVDHSLDSEFTIRLLHAAILLSDVHYPFTLEGPTLPSFMFFLDSLEEALDLDTLWGDEFFERMRPKAIATRNSIEDLIHQFLELNVALSQASSPSEASTPDGSDEEVAAPLLPALSGTPTLKVKRSKMAKRQMRLKMEEEYWMAEMTKVRWVDQVDPQQSVDLLCSPMRSIDLDNKTATTVAVTEILPAE